MGMCFLRSDPGFVVALPEPLHLILTGLRIRSIVAGEIATSASVTQEPRLEGDFEKADSKNLVVTVR